MLQVQAEFVLALVVPDHHDLEFINVTVSGKTRHVRENPDRAIC